MNLPKKQSLDVQTLITNHQQKKSGHFIEKLMPKLLLIAASVSILTTIGIVCTLLFETIEFFSRVSIVEFLTATEWLPFAKDPVYGVLPLVVGTLKVTMIAILIAVPLGLSIAIYLSEYAHKKVKRIIKPILEVLGGIPTIVYGFFALTFVTPIIQKLFPSVEIFNAISPGMMIGIMILPTIASVSEDAMSSVPDSIREGAYGLGATKLEVVLKVVIPAALSGILASIVLGMSRAVGETMIVALAAGATPLLNWQLNDSIQTMTAYIVQVSSGDAGYGTTIYYSIYAVGFTLFIFTLLMNTLANWISKRFKEAY